MRWLLLPLIGLAAAAPAAERRLYVSSFDRLRVDGPFRVIVTAGKSPSGSMSGDARRLDGVEVRQEGTTVTVRPASTTDDAGRTAGPAQPVTVTLATPALAGAALIGTGAISVAGMKGERVTLSVAGTGTIGVTGADAVELAATTIGTGRIAVAGKATRARLLVNGAGGVQADGLDAGELTIRLDGPGDVAARARYLANITNTGLGRITVAGPAKCVVKVVTTGSVVCGAKSAADRRPAVGAPDLPGARPE